ncbi:alpha/beta hydrolase [Arenibacterium halophilum]|uniref:Alpha/beta hydrolase n=1 Tax=Arenibacterium halophilum TaxID=2583821 RepID=A0ABY2XF31_9RHOB|nr:alpha/beta hydrolase [Arenibacterium halophilum]TMV15636.1 alpha/beta hydrolase [Arenibacterium halophilum]
MELDDAYANGAYIEGAEAYPDRWAALARDFTFAQTARGKARMGVPYGTGAREKFDLFLPEADAPRGLLIFVHGGYWLRFDRSDWSHLAKGALAHGFAVAMPSYDHCPDVRISKITQQIAQAVAAAAVLVDGPIALAGHSAGGHLVARMCAPGLLPPEVAVRLAHVMPISPLSDLHPLMQTSMNADLGLTEEEARAESPLFQPAPAVPVTVWVGADERPAFLDQARWLAETWGCGHVVAPGKHHFDVIDALAEPDSQMIATLVGG